jgi:hypothetical protein
VRFSRYLIEEVSQITHLEHFEDLLIQKGVRGFYILRDIVAGLGKPNENVVYQVKIDGSPSCYFGTDPLDNKFFLSTKSLFNKNPKIAKSESDVVRLFGNGGLSEKLLAAFKYLSKLHLDPDIVYQSDILFTSEDKKETIIDGQKYITFKPNVIVYAVSPSLKNLYNNIKTAKFGLVVHTMYKIVKRTNDGFSLRTIPYNFKPLVNQSGGELFITDNIIQGVKVPPTLDLKLMNRINALEKDIANNHVMDELRQKDAALPGYIMRFINAQLDQPDLGIFGDVNSGQKFKGDVYFKEMLDFCMLAYDKDMTGKDVGDMEMLKNRMVKVMLRNKRNLILLLYVYFNMIDMKNQIMTLFSDDNVFSGTYKEESGAMVPTPNEGIVILARDNIVKLVDRAEFSATNRKLGRFRKQ